MFESHQGSSVAAAHPARVWGKPSRRQVLFFLNIKVRISKARCSLVLPVLSLSELSRRAHSGDVPLLCTRGLGASCGHRCCPSLLPLSCDVPLCGSGTTGPPALLSVHSWVAGEAQRHVPVQVPRGTEAGLGPGCIPGRAGAISSLLHAAPRAFPSSHSHRHRCWRL